MSCFPFSFLTLPILKAAPHRAHLTESSGWKLVENFSRLSSVALESSENRSQRSAESGRTSRRTRFDKAFRAFIYFLLSNPVQLSNVCRTATFRVHRRPSADENHKKLKAWGENNIIRDYFHSSAGFFTAPQKPTKERTDCPWIIDFFAFPAPCEPFTPHIVSTPTWIMLPSRDQHPPPHEFFKKPLVFYLREKRRKQNIVFIFSARLRHAKNVRANLIKRIFRRR